MGLTKSAAGVSWSLPSGEFQDREFDIYSERLIDTWYRDPVRRAWASRTWGGRAPRVVLEIFAAGAWSAELDRQLALTGRSGQTIRQLAKVDHDTYNSLASMSTERWLDWAEKATASLKETYEQQDATPEPQEQC